MAVEETLKSIYEQTKSKFKLNLLAGKGGMDTIISWVHLIEDVSTTDFIRGNELIITTGLGFKGEKWLESFIADLIKMNAKGLIINVGTYIPQIPKSTIAYCEVNNFPLFSMPWEIHLVDIMQDYCNKILQAERVELDESEMFIKALLDLSPREAYQAYFDEHGYHLQAEYCAVVIRLEETVMDYEKNHILKQIRISLSNKLRRNHVRFNIVSYHDQLVVVLYDINREQSRKIAEELGVLLKEKYALHHVMMVVGPTVSGLGLLHKSFKRALAAMKKQYVNAQGICFYDDLGVEKILIEVEDRALLKEVCEEVLGSLMVYDQKNNTDYVEILRLYVFNDCSIHAVAQKSYTHRNTINYRMNKIKTIIPYDLSDAASRLRYQVAFYIKDLLG